VLASLPPPPNQGARTARAPVSLVCGNQRRRRKTGIRIPGGTPAEQAKWILGRREREWREWRCSVIADWVSQIRAVIQTKRPGILLGNYQCPWRDTDFGGARRRTLGLDLRLLAPLVDVMSPMLYHRRMGRSPGWVGESVEWLSRTVISSAGKAPLIWPIVQAHNDPGRRQRRGVP
jgi:hypothetical protein